MSEFNGVYGSLIKTIAAIYVIGRSLCSLAMTILRVIVRFLVLSTVGVLFVYLFASVPKNQIFIVAAIPLTSLLILEKIIQLLPVPEQLSQGNANSVPSKGQFVLGAIFVLSALLAFVPFLSYFLYRWMRINYLLPICAQAALVLSGLSIFTLALLVIVEARRLRVLTGHSLPSILLHLTRTQFLTLRHIFGSIFAENIQVARDVRP